MKVDWIHCVGWTIAVLGAWAIVDGAQLPGILILGILILLNSALLLSHIEARRDEEKGKAKE